MDETFIHLKNWKMVQYHLRENAIFWGFQCLFSALEICWGTWKISKEAQSLVNEKIRDHHEKVRDHPQIIFIMLNRFCAISNPRPVPLSPHVVNLLRANRTKWSNTLKQFVGNLPTNCLSVFDRFVKLTIKRLKDNIKLDGIPSKIN